MKTDEIKEMSQKQLRTALDESRQELFNLRFQIATRKIKNHSRIPTVKRNIARMMTTLRERELMAEFGGADFEAMEDSAPAARETGARRGSLLGRLGRGKR